MKTSDFSDNTSITRKEPSILDTLITSKTRRKLLLKFFLNSSAYSYLRNLEDELNESPNALRIELIKFEKAKILISEQKGNKKIYYANTAHPLFNEIRNIIIKTFGFDQIINLVVSKMNHVKEVYITGSFAQGIPSNIIDLLFIGEDFNTETLLKLMERAEKKINRRIRYLTLKMSELKDYIKSGKPDIFLLWKMT